MKNYFFLLILLYSYSGLFAQNPVIIPGTLKGINFTLEVAADSFEFFKGKKTPTYGVNGPILGPTLMVYPNDSINIEIRNKLPYATTMHWHGLHVSGAMDGGPHLSIPSGKSWFPAFKIRNKPGTYWYHPHGLGQTDPHVSKGIAGFFIVQDTSPNRPDLPERYGIDDFPLAIQTKAFDSKYQIAVSTEMDTTLMVNATLNPYLNLPAQIVRLRLLNGSSMRSYMLGFTGLDSFYIIGMEGGLMDAPEKTNRIPLHPGERAEVLLDLNGRENASFKLMGFNSELDSGIYGSAWVGSGPDTIETYRNNFLNGTDFTIMDINVTAPIPGPKPAIPTTLLPLNIPAISEIRTSRTFIFDTIRHLPMDVPNLAMGPFGINNAVFDMDSINFNVQVNSVEKWTFINKTKIAHPFHIHDIQFYILNQGKKPVPYKYRGLKDIIMVMPYDTVSFITRFGYLVDDMYPYMYHCHLLHHEDDGMMGSFVVVDSSTKTGIPNFNNEIYGEFSIYPNPGTSSFILHSIHGIKQIFFYAPDGRLVYTHHGTGQNQVTLNYPEEGKVFILKFETTSGKWYQKLVLKN